MISTILYKENEGLHCHSVGLLGCIHIVENQIDFETYSYDVIYEDRIITDVDNVVLATDISLT